MAYLGEGPITLNPNHPFAHSQISFGMKRPDNLSSESEKPKAEEPSTRPPAADSIPKDEEH